MGLLDGLLEGLGLKAPGKPARPATAGVTVRLERDGAPVPPTGLAGGHLLEAHAILDEQHELVAADHIRIHLDEDKAFGDKRVVTLDGTPPAPLPAATVACTTAFATVPEGRDVAWVVEDHKRTAADFTTTILVVTERPAADMNRRRTHVLGWLRPAHADAAGTTEFVAVLDVAGGAQGTSAPVEIGVAAAGVAVRASGALTDADLTNPPLFGLLPDVVVTLGGRTAVSGPDGRFVVDARLPVGTHILRIARPGVTARDLQVEVAVAGVGAATATLRDESATTLATATTPAAVTAASVLTLAVGGAVPLYVHKLRGTVLWPDSRQAAGAFRRTPLAERRVYVMPVPDGADISAFRPKTTREWEQLKRRPDVLRSARVDEPPLAARTAADGRFEVRYVDLMPGRRHLLWVERLDDTGAETPEHVVRTETVALRRLFRNNLDDAGDGGIFRNDDRKLVDHEYNLTQDPVAWGLDALRVENIPGGVGVRLIRPTAASRTTFDGVPRPPIATVLATVLTTPAAPAAQPPGAPPARVADIDLQVLPVVPLHEAPGDRGAGVRRAYARLVETARTMFPAGHDLGDVRLAVDVRRLANWIDFGVAAEWDAADDPGVTARAVRLLETTFVLRDGLVTIVTAAGRVTGIARAVWHVDAVSLADRAYVTLSGGDGVDDRTLGVHGVAPLFAPVSPVLAAVPPHGVYLAPGHGMWPSNGNQTSADPARWNSNRGGWTENAGEDEVDALIARTVWQLLRRNDGAVHSPRAIDDLNALGVSQTAAGAFTEVAAATFPRLWQQNPVYAFGARRDARVTAHPTWAAVWGLPAGVKDNHGVFARVEHIRRLARDGAISISVSLHTDSRPAGAVNPARGTKVEYLNAHPPGAPAGEGNPNAFRLATLLANTVHARSGFRLIQGDGVLTMLDVGGGPVRDLIDTFDHWEHNGGAEQTRERIAPGAPPNPANWTQKPFPEDLPGGPPRPWLPVTLIEFGFHDNQTDARVLSRQWFRQRCGEGVAMAIDAMLRERPAPVSRDDLRAVLGREVGRVKAVRDLPAGPAAVTQAAAQAALDSIVADPADIPPFVGPVLPLTTLQGLLEGIRRAATALTRRQLVALIAEAVRGPAGWPFGDTPATLAAWITATVLGGETLTRPDDLPTRAEAGEWACRAIGFVPASLDLAQTKPVGSPSIPLVDPAPDAADALFSRAAAELLEGRLQRLTRADVHRVAGVTLADGGWQRLSRLTRGDRYDLHAGVPVSVIVETAGAPWKTTTPDLADVQIIVAAAGRRTTLGCVRREPGRVVSAMWIPTLASTAASIDVSVELRLRHRVDGWQPVGSKAVQMQVLPTPAP